MNTEVRRDEILRQHEIALELSGKLQGKKALVRTFGCQQNEADGERIAGELTECGYELTDSPAEADLVILNTCAVREHAENRVLGIIGTVKKEKEKRPELNIALCGCMAQEPHRQELLRKNYPYVDLVFGTDRIHRIPEMIRDLLQNRDGKKGKRSGQKQYVTDLPHGEFGVITEETPVVRTSSYRALVSVMYGCNNFCSYCIVPFVRGRERSRRPENVLEEVSALVRDGYKDIMLLGQNVNSYRGEKTFPELLRACASFDGEYWVRFMTSHPKDASEELIRVMAEQPRVADHFHLPFQSGNDRILSEMRRRYTRESYLEKAMRIRELLPDAALTSDVIIGFPTETEKEFLDTVDLVRAVRFDLLYMFLYSPRVGTDAEKMEGRIPHEEQVRRFDYLSDVQNRIAEERNRELVGKSVRVLSDGKTGRTSQNKIIALDREVPAGTFCTARVTGVKQYNLIGEVEGKPDGSEEKENSHG